VDEITALRSLAERLALGQHVMTSAPTRPEILPAAVPDDLPVSIPRPDDATIIGTIRQNTMEPGPVQRLQILLDTSLTVDQVRAFYQDRLGQAGWSQIEDLGMPAGGFTGFSSTLYFETDIVQGESGLHLTVGGHPGPTGTTQVDLIVILYPAGSAWMAQRAVRSLHRKALFPHRLLPLLQLPPGTTVVAGVGGGGSTYRSDSGMDVESELDGAAFAAFFLPQLEQAGWTRQDGGTAGALTWSSWAVADEAGAPWRGVLYVLQCPDRAHRYRLSLLVEWPGAYTMFV